MKLKFENQAAGKMQRGKKKNLALELFLRNMRTVPKLKAVWIFSCMLGEACVTTRGRFKKTTVQTDS